MLSSGFYCFGKGLGFEEFPPVMDRSDIVIPVLDTKNQRECAESGSLYYIVSFLRGWQKMLLSFVIAGVRKGIGNTHEGK